MGKKNNQFDSIKIRCGTCNRWKKVGQTEADAWGGPRDFGPCLWELPQGLKLPASFSRPINMLETAGINCPCWESTIEQHKNG